MVFVPPRLYSLKHFTVGAFAVPFRADKNMMGSNVLLPGIVASQGRTNFQSIRHGIYYIFYGKAVIPASLNLSSLIIGSFLVRNSHRHAFWKIE